MAKNKKLSVQYHRLSPQRVLVMMKQGIQLTFPSGYFLRGNTSTKYIETGHEFGSDGQWDMTAEGAENAVNEAKKYEQAQLKET